MANNVIKKRIMYLSGEDFYLFCYSMFVVLDVLGCHGGKVFRDYRKLAFLINIMNDEKLIYILNSEHVNTYDQEYLYSSYSNGLMKRSEILKLIFTLEKKGFVTLSRGKTNQEIDVSLDKTSIPGSFFDKHVFSVEYNHVKTIKKSVPKLNSLTLDTMLKKIYADKGVKTWAI